MKKIINFILALALLSACTDSGNEAPTDNVYQDFKDGRVLELSGPEIWLANLVDVNSDGFYDYEFTVHKTGGAFYISVAGVTEYLQDNNPFYPVVQRDEDAPVTITETPVIWYMAILYSTGEEIEVAENAMNAALLSKKDEFRNRSAYRRFLYSDCHGKGW